MFIPEVRRRGVNIDDDLLFDVEERTAELLGVILVDGVPCLGVNILIFVLSRHL